MVVKLVKLQLLVGKCCQLRAENINSYAKLAYFKYVFMTCKNCYHFSSKMVTISIHDKLYAKSANIVRLNIAYTFQHFATKCFKIY